jgi:hypothetical protein
MGLSDFTLDADGFYTGIKTGSDTLHEVPPPMIHQEADAVIIGDRLFSIQNEKTGAIPNTPGDSSANRLDSSTFLPPRYFHYWMDLSVAQSQYDAAAGVIPADTPGLWNALPDIPIVLDGPKWSAASVVNPKNGNLIHMNGGRDDAWEFDPDTNSFVVTGQAVSRAPHSICASAYDEATDTGYIVCSTSSVVSIMPDSSFDASTGQLAGDFTIEIDPAGETNGEQVCLVEREADDRIYGIRTDGSVFRVDPDGTFTEVDDGAGITDWSQDGAVHNYGDCAAVDELDAVFYLPAATSSLGTVNAWAYKF